MNTKTTSTTNRIFYPGLEYLRIIFIILIVGWHTKVLGQATFYSHATRINPIDFSYFSFFLLGAPCFFIVSQYLYIQNRRKRYFSKRIFSLAYFFIFWNLIAFAIFADQSTAHNWLAPEFIMRGGYGPLYFIFDLMVITVIMELICLCYERFKTGMYMIMMYFALFLTVLFSVITPFILKPNGFLTNYLLSFQNFINFLPYGIIAFLISEKVKNNEKDGAISSKFNWLKYLSVFILGMIVSLMEYLVYNKFLSSQYFEQVFPFYNRIGTFILTTVFFYLFLMSKKPVNKYLGILASLTGGVFIIHYIILNLVCRNFLNWCVYNVHHPVLFLSTVLILSYVISWILKMRRIV